MHKTSSFGTMFSVPLASLVAEGDRWLTGDGTQFSQGSGGLPLKAVLNVLHTFDAANSHLAMPSNKHNSCHPSPRTTLLDPQVPVYGTYLTLAYLDHDGYFVLSRLDTQDAMVEQLCGPAGICNPYVGFMIAYRKGVCLPYRIRYTDLKGHTKELDKNYPGHVPDDWDFETDTYRDVTIQWQSRITM